MRDIPAPSDLADRTFDRILLIKPSSLGDVVHALPVLRGLRRRYPSATIDWLISTACAPLLANHPDINELILFDRRRYGRIGRSAGATRDFLRFLGELRRRRYDLVIDLQGLFRTGFFSWTTGAPARIGFRQAREGAAMFYTHRLDADDPDEHAVDRYYRLAHWLGFTDVPVAFELPIAPDARAHARHLLESHGLSDGQPFVGVAPGARWETKRWQHEGFADVIDRIHDAGTARVVLLGGPDEHPRCQRVAEHCRTSPVNLAGQTDLPQLVAIIEAAALVLCHDSAAAHLAAALDRPLVCITGPTNPARTGPYNRPGAVVRLDLDCSPCYLRKLSQCRHDHRCMRELSPDAVWSAVRRDLPAAITSA